MRNLRHISLVLLLCAAFGCTSTVYVDLEDKGEQIVLNAQMSTFNSHHGVYVSLISRKGIFAPEAERTEVTYSINGGAPVQMTRDDHWTRYYNYYVLYGSTQKSEEARYCFDAALHPGDRITIRSKVGDKTASASVTAPAAPEVASIDTATVSVFNRIYNEMEDKLQIKLLLRDPSLSADFYRLYASADTEVDGRCFREERELDISSEPVLSPETSTEDNVFADLFSSGNSWGLFTDVSLDGQAYTLKVYADEYVTEDEMYLSWDGPSDYASVDANIHLEAISFEQYHYLKAEDQGAEGSFFSEPVSMPSNVEGGIGFVSLVSDYHFTLSNFVIKNVRSTDDFDDEDD